MKRLTTCLPALVLVLVVRGLVAAGDIDFEGLPFTDFAGGDIIPEPASVLTDDFLSDGVIFGKSAVSAGVAVVRDSLAPSSGLNSAVGLNAAGIIPGSTTGGGVGDIFFSFALPGTSTPAYTDVVSFTIGDAGGDLDVFEIRSFDLASTLIDVQNVSGSSRFPVAIDVPGIHRVEIDFSGHFGYSLDDLSFNTPVPEPSTFALLAVGAVALLGCACRKRRSCRLLS